MPSLFEPLKVGSLDLPNRIIMAPLTRCRAVDERVPNALMAEYYVQRASAGLILAEATAIHPMGVGYPSTPGIWSEAQIEGWRMITDAVHKAGGRIVLQLWHVGRISDPFYLNGELPVAPSAIAPVGNVSLIRPLKPFVTPRALETDEVGEVVETYKQAALNAMSAGFDGVEIHGANGYLLDQFLHNSSNQRTDRYGGSIENRARFMLEATDAICSVVDPGRVGMHLAPRGDAHDVGSCDGADIFTYVAKELGKRKIAFICARESQESPRLSPAMKEAFGGVWIANEGLDCASATKLLESGEADAAAFGKLYIANPDLPERFKQGAELNEPKPELFYGEGAEGYTDYPAMH